ncbi:hypothetical protein MKW98_006498 [Papaver atlanticum]|uniref:Uncharacterized protein n=1 Tax=Papaver atlanticum TaxID=357466 RepID=A0AAD4TCY5_9MAGN|nr:hypothetical protein MKW98_006498 [Papaver atlanticum]
MNHQIYFWEQQSDANTISDKEVIGSWDKPRGHQTVVPMVMDLLALAKDWNLRNLSKRSFQGPGKQTRKHDEVLEDDKMVQAHGADAMVHDNMFKAIRDLYVFSMIRNIMSMSINVSSNSKSCGRASWLIGTFVEAVEELGDGEMII